MDPLSKIKRSFRAGGFPLVWKKAVKKIKTYYLWHFAREMPADELSYFAHPLPNGLPRVEVEVKEFKPTEEDVALAARLLTAVHKALRDEAQYLKSDMDLWDVIRQDYQQDFFGILRSGDPRRTAEYLCNMHRHGLTQGISGGMLSNDRSVVSSAQARRRKGALVKDILVSFAEATGALPNGVSSAKAEGWDIYDDADALVQSIEKKLGVSVSPPDIDGGLTKLKLKEGSFDERDMWSLYAAWRISCLVPRGARIAEIGAGTGKAALYANRFGFPDYAIFDLPLLNLVQGWYLIKGLPGKKVVLYGESGGPEDSIKILPYWEFTESKSTYDLVLNADSFPEISREVVEDYLRKIKACASYFLSINQEHGLPLIEGTDKRHLVVPEVIEKIGGFELAYRQPFLLRKNYFEEFYKVL
ncbi:MAG: putative sugar O-methyltransferase [Minisyncoccia bacterium]